MVNSGWKYETKNNRRPHEGGLTKWQEKITIKREKILLTNGKTIVT